MGIFTVDNWFKTDLQRDIWHKKYKHKEETFDEFFDRVSGGNKTIKEYMLEKVEAAHVSACKKEFGNNVNVRVAIDTAKETVKVYLQKTVVENVEYPQTEISLEEARKLSKRHTLGKVVDIEVKLKNFILRISFFNVAGSENFRKLS